MELEQSTVNNVSSLPPVTMFLNLNKLYIEFNKKNFNLNITESKQELKCPFLCLDLQ